jgi:hypothetical protein
LWRVQSLWSSSRAPSRVGSSSAFRSAVLLSAFEMQAWLDQNCGADSWAMIPAGLRGIGNDAVVIYFLDATLAAVFVARWCTGSNVEISDRAFASARTSQRHGMNPDCTRPASEARVG